MKYVVQVMTMGDMSPAGLSHAYYNSPDGEPEDIVVDTLAVYNTKQEALDNRDADKETFLNKYGDDSGCWVECVFLQNHEVDPEFLSSDELYDVINRDYEDV